MQSTRSGITRHASLRRGGTHPLATTPTTARNDVASPGSGHARTKSVHSFPTAFTGLIRSLHKDPQYCVFARGSWLGAASPTVKAIFFINRVTQLRERKKKCCTLFCGKSIRTLLNFFGEGMQRKFFAPRDKRIRCLPRAKSPLRNHTALFSTRVTARRCKWGGRV